MHFNVHHITRYLYSRPVALDPHTLRLRPRSDGSQIVKNYTLEINPRPAGMTEFTDLEGNAAAQVWFSELTRELSITVLTEVETLRENPYDFIVAEPGIIKLPVRYMNGSKGNLSPYCQPVLRDGPVSWYAEDIARATGRDTLRFLAAITNDLHENIELIVRPNGEPQSPEDTLKMRQGASRDVAMLFMEAVRTQGLASRFTSGYWNGLAADGQSYLHAWVEVYFPQNGWRGFDPSTGLAVADQHVPIASGLYPGSAASITGAFWGSDVKSTMETTLSFRAN